MEPALKSRLIGAAVLVAIAVIVVPMFFPAAPPDAGGKKSMSLNIPAAPSSQMRSQTLPIGPQAAGSSAAAAPASVSSDHLATVNIKSSKPPSVEPDRSTASNGDSASAQHAAAPTPDQEHGQQQPAPAPPHAAPKPANKAAAEPGSAEHEASAAPGKAANARYMLNLGAYGKRANAQRLLQRVAKLGYPVKVHATRISGKPAARVTAGPFDSRASAEAARLKIKGAVHGVPAKLTSAAGDQRGNAPESALPAHRAGAWAVQLAAFSHKADAVKLRDRARAAGFDSYLDDVKSGGKTLWRVRVGPQTQRSDAVKAKADLKAKLKLGGVVVTTS